MKKDLVIKFKLVVEGDKIRVFAGDGLDRELKSLQTNILDLCTRLDVHHKQVLWEYLNQS